MQSGNSSVVEQHTIKPLRIDRKDRKEGNKPDGIDRSIKREERCKPSKQTKQPPVTARDGQNGRMTPPAASGLLPCALVFRPKLQQAKVDLGISRPDGRFFQSDDQLLTMAAIE